MKAVLKKSWPIIIFLIIVGAELLFGIGTINNNIDDPNRITYFSADEGGLADIMWLHYSGEKRQSFQWYWDYGLEMIYMADFARLLSPFINFTPETFILLLRWIHFLASILCLFALWRLVGYHFGKGWQQVLAVIFLSARPTFPGNFHTLKPDSLVLLFMLIGLDYSLRIIKEPRLKRNLFIAAACASLATVIKYSGIFLLPAIIMAVYLARRYQRQTYGKTVFPVLKIAWLLSFLVGIIFIILPVSFILFYIRKATGLSWYQQYGLYGSLLRDKIILFTCLSGLFLILLSPVIWILDRINNRFFKKIIAWFDEFSSHTSLVFGLFLAFILIFAFKLVLNPRLFINIYAPLGPTLFGSEAAVVLSKAGILQAFLYNIRDKCSLLDGIVLLLFLFYICMELFYWKQSLKADRLKTYKRIVLLTFVLIPLVMIFLSTVKVTAVHLVPFFIIMALLAIQGFQIFNNLYRGRRTAKSIITFFLCMLFIIDIAINSSITMREKIKLMHQREDLAYDIGQWWRYNIPSNARIVADHYMNAYIPSGYENVKVCGWDSENRLQELRHLVNAYRPQYIYYNERSFEKDGVIPSMAEMLPGYRSRLVKSFNGKARRYQRHKRDKFVVYEIIY